jgi:hypothetical protein
MNLRLTCILGCVCLLTAAVVAQEESDSASIHSSIDNDGTGKIVVEARGKIPEPPLFYTANAKTDVKVGLQSIEQTVELTINVIQGKAKTMSVDLRGEGEVVDVVGQNIRSWSVRKEGLRRFLDLHLNDEPNQEQGDWSVRDLSTVVKMRTTDLKIPGSIELLHLGAGSTVGFDSIVSIEYQSRVKGKVTRVEGFLPVDRDDSQATGSVQRFQSTSGGAIELELNHDGASPGPIEFVGNSLEGELSKDGKSIQFQLRGTAHVTEPGAETEILAGQAAVSELSDNSGYRIRLSTESEQPVYKIVFDRAGMFPIALDFVANVNAPEVQGRSTDFKIASSAIVPLNLKGFESGLLFHRDQESVVPVRRENDWIGFLPANGRAKLQWKPQRKTSEGKLFFTTTGLVHASVGTGLLRQDHQIDYHVLQGELKSLSIQLQGPGEILDVQCGNLVSWDVSGQNDERRLDITLSQPMTSASQIKVRSQTTLGAFPARVEGMRLNPIGTIRHSGYLRLANSGLVRLEPMNLSGLTQLAPEQFPGEPIDAKQTFVYRFPSANHAFAISADQIQPEVSVSELVLYQVAEIDRVIKADIELDIREAPLREWDFQIPADYSVVAVTGASVSDYVLESEDIASEDVGAQGRKNLKVIFSGDVAGRQLIALHLEKSESTKKTDWELPRIEYPGAKNVRGDIGVLGAPGFRISVGEAKLLVEKPLSYFPKPFADLQQAFRIREPGWSATMRIERRQRNVQSDVFHLYSLGDETAYGSALINYFVTGAPVSEWKIQVPESLANLMVDGQDVRTWRREADALIVTLHQPVMGPYTLLLTFEEKPGENKGEFRPGTVTPLEVQSERGYVQVVSPMQVEMDTLSVSPDLLKLDALELPAEFRLLSMAPVLGTWQYTQRPFDLNLKVAWFQPGTMAAQVIEFSEANSRVSRDGELVTEVTYFVKSRGQRTLKIQLPPSPVRLWEVSVAGQDVNARQATDTMLIPLPGGTDPNTPIEVRLRLGKPVVDESHPELALPIVFTPILKTQWKVTGDEKYALVPGGGTLLPIDPVVRPSGFRWVERSGLGALLWIVLFSAIGFWGSRRKRFLRILGWLCLLAAFGVSAGAALSALLQTAPPSPLELSLPILASGEAIRLNVTSTPLWRVNVSWFGVFLILAGAGAWLWAWKETSEISKLLARWAGILLISIGALFQGDGAPWFFGMLALAILVLLWLGPFIESARELLQWMRSPSRQSESESQTDPAVSGGEIGSIPQALFVIALGTIFGSDSFAATGETFAASDEIKQNWQVSHEDSRLNVQAKIQVTGVPGDQFLLLRSPAVLTKFEATGLRLQTAEVSEQGLVYVIRILKAENKTASESPDEIDPKETKDSEKTNGDESQALDKPKRYSATFEYQLEDVRALEGIPVLTGAATVQEIDFVYDESGWDVFSPSAVRIETKESPESTSAKVLLGPTPATLFLKAKARDVTTESTQFFVEVSNLYLPSPGVVDGKHRVHVRTSQGQVSSLGVKIPKGITVVAVNGPIGSWQFDADQDRLKLEIEPAQSESFDVIIETQRGLDPLPLNIALSPLVVDEATGQVGLVGVAFGPDAQPETLQSEGMSAVNLGDFDNSLMVNQQAVLHRVFRYSAEGGELKARIAPVEPEVRVTSKQVLSLGDERVVLSVNFVTEITRAGMFQLSFPLPKGVEVESLSGESLHHWAELTQDAGREIILHLNGKTMGIQHFNLTLSGVAPTEIGDWEIPRFELNEANRQSGDLVVRPTTGIRLRTVSRQNISEADPRSLGGQAQGSLAFRLLQRDWQLVLGVEKLDPWVTGEVLHDVTLREGQTRSSLLASFNVQNASISSMQIELPLNETDEIKTLHASGETVSDFLRTAPDSKLWEIRFKRRVIGKVGFRIEYERRGDRENDQEWLSPARFPQARQISYFLSVRAGGRLELQHDPLSPGWQSVDWTTVPTEIRDNENRSAPAFVFKCSMPETKLAINAKRHSLADALKLRVTQGVLTTVLSPNGDQLTEVDVAIEVIQRSSLAVGLPSGGEMMSLFVNDESVNSIRETGSENSWQFYILPGIDDRTANVRFVYTVGGQSLRRLELVSPKLNVPLENIRWNVIAPQGYELTNHDGNLELVNRTEQQTYNRDSYLLSVSGKRKIQAEEASQLLQQANDLLQSGQQSKANWAFNSVANRYALDAASNEDARVQLETVQTQQAIVGLNTRRQRLYVDNSPVDGNAKDDSQIRAAAANNPILRQEQLNFRPQELSQLLQGNTNEDNAVLQQIAARLVQHQRTTEPAPQTILISLPEEGSVYNFTRSVQVAENAQLELDLDFALERRLQFWRSGLLLGLLAGIAGLLAWGMVRTRWTLG